MLSLISLPYAADALAPAISAQTLSFHHGKHLKAYVDNANALLPGTGLEEAPLEEVVIRSAGALRLNAGQVLNHNLYFTSLRTPREGNRPDGKLLAAIEAHFGSFDAFWDAFAKAALTQFGSGWAFLSADAKDRLVISQEPNAGNPLQKGLVPLLTIDVWEHAYYLDWQNRRADYIAALRPLIDWDAVAARYKG